MNPKPIFVVRILPAQTQFRNQAFESSTMPKVASPVGLYWPVISSFRSGLVLKMGSIVDSIAGKTTFGSLAFETSTINENADTAWDFRQTNPVSETECTPIKGGVICSYHKLPSL